MEDPAFSDGGLVEISDVSVWAGAVLDTEKLRQLYQQANSTDVDLLRNVFLHPDAAGDDGVIRLVDEYIESPIEYLVNYLIIRDATLFFGPEIQPVVLACCARLPSPLSQLPAELWHLVFAYLPAEDRVVASAATTTLRTQVDSYAEGSSPIAVAHHQSVGEAKQRAATRRKRFETYFLQWSRQHTQQLAELRACADGAQKAFRCGRDEVASLFGWPIKIDDACKASLSASDLLERKIRGWVAQVSSSTRQLHELVQEDDRQREEAWEELKADLIAARGRLENVADYLFLLAHDGKAPGRRYKDHTLGRILIDHALGRPDTQHLFAWAAGELAEAKIPFLRASYSDAVTMEAQETFRAWQACHQEWYDEFYAKLLAALESFEQFCRAQSKEQPGRRWRR